LHFIGSFRRLHAQCKKKYAAVEVKKKINCEEEIASKLGFHNDGCDNAAVCSSFFLPGTVSLPL
jgi:hypothetical protein